MSERTPPPADGPGESPPPPYSPPAAAPGPAPAPGERVQQVLSAQEAGGVEVRATIEAAEIAAEEIRREAEQRAREHLRAAREHADRLTGERVRSIAAATDELIAQATTIRARSDELAEALRRATEMLSAAFEPAAASPTPQTIPAPTAPTPQAIPAPTAISATGVHEDAPLGARSDGPDGPEYRARQLATAGASRRTIAIVLRREFGVEPSPIIERVLG